MRSENADGLIDRVELCVMIEAAPQIEVAGSAHGIIRSASGLLPESPSPEA
jgi:hypothetical protein